VVFDQVGSASHQISLLEKELQGIEQERTELVRRQSRLLDLYERAESNMLEEIDVRISQLKKAQEALKRRQIECEERIVYYRQQQIEPDQVYQILSQIEEIIRFATPAHRQEIFRSLFCEMTVKRDRTLEVSASLPTEGVVQRLSVTLIPPGEQEEKVYQNSQQKGVIPR
jgi:hypothetical protein